jgi:hypothetical protein
VTVRAATISTGGALSEEALSRFVNFFLSMCIDQVQFMEGLMQPDKLRIRILLWAEEEIRLGTLPAKSATFWKSCSIAASCRGATRQRPSARRTGTLAGLCPR